MKVYTHIKTGRACYDFPWHSSGPCPWDQGKYIRVVMPFTDREARNSHKKVHIQIIKRSSLELVKPTRLMIH